MPTKNANETIYLQRVELGEICFLHELLYYVAFGRLPVWLDAGDNLRMELVGHIDGALTDDECKNCARPLPPDPRLKYDWSFGVMLCDDLATIVACAEKHASEASEQDGSHDENAKIEQARNEAAKLHKEISDWRPKYEMAIELAAAKVFAALREGHLRSMGRLLPDPDLAVSLKGLKQQGKEAAELENVAIPQDFWSLQHINWELCAARNDEAHYCHIDCPIEDVMSLFPHNDVPVGVVTADVPINVMRRGSFFALPGSAASPAIAGRRSQPRSRKEGRPQEFQWDILRIEVTAIVARDGKLPPKRDSLVAELQAICKKLGWQKTPADRTLRDFLKPYYTRFGGNADR